MDPVSAVWWPSRRSQSAQRSWFATSVQAGFEIWNGGTGLKINQFAVGAQ